MSGAATGPMLSPSSREPGHAERGSLPGEGTQGRWARFDPFDHDIEAALGLGHAHPRLALAAEQRGERLFEPGQALDDRWREHRADVDVDQLMRAGAAIAERDARLRPTERERGAPPVAKRDRPYVLDLRFKPARAQGRHDELALPGEIGALLQMLEGAAAANAEMRADRRYAVGARPEERRAGGPDRFRVQQRRAQAPPASAKGTKSGPPAVSATPSPWAPSRSILTSSSILYPKSRADQKFLVAAAAENRRGDLAHDCPAGVLDERPHLFHSLLPVGFRPARCRLCRPPRGQPRIAA